MTEIRYPGDPGFETARVDRIFNRRLPGRQPAAILKATNTEDVQAGVRLARDRGWQVAVRSGGHSWAQWSIRDDALVIDLGGLREMSYDPSSFLVSVSPAIRGGLELAPFLEQHGRFFVGGHCPTVGLGGFLLQGGQGWNARGWGWAAEYVEAVDVVTADGSLVRASATENADLYWAARGAGPGFPGVVVRFHLRTLPMPGHVAHTVQAYRLDDFDEVMTWLHGMHHTVAGTVEIVALTKTDPVLSPSPVLLVTAVALVSSAAEADAALAPFRDNPALDRALLSIDAVPTTLAKERERQLADNPEGHRWAVDNAWLSGPAEKVVPAMRRAYTTLPNEKAFTIWFSMAPLRDLPDMAFSVQSEIYLASYVLWESPADDERCQAWLADAMADLAPVTVGAYLGDSDLRRRPMRVLSEPAERRYREILDVRDPDRLFTGYLA
ncbi:oxidoreductase [Actinoplanes lobatus]|uniref:FAD/FMN-containing dehydrogenase n=1 Tax=Actinoplanes lobatus TaxID=113568 RepID=A0A7W7MI30_9ACTN|nr:FAD-binding protein [Actinoplanes lobatus]MBB4751084.1 FAD/FMN-containing dehydrogenase [Actinoplanes lobatus]GGN92584.1 oxidoreductase [Actinoplanes lobatus]GIE44962.1 oxidoreductase [Actinoplanes lobatus]